MIRFPWLRRHRRWIAAGAAVIVVPALLLVALNYQRKLLFAELRPVGIPLVPRAPAVLAPAVAWFHIDPLRVPLFWTIDRSRGIVISTDHSPSESEMRRVVAALNELGGIESVRVSSGDRFLSGDELLDPKLLAPLAELHGLERLDIEPCGLNDEALEVIGGCGSLRELNLAHNGPFTTAGLDRLAGLRNLERLNLSNCVAEVELPRLDNLRELRLDHNGMLEGDDLRPLAGLSGLEKLSLVGSVRQFNTVDGAFERDVLPVIAALPALKELRVGLNGGIPPARIAKLEAARPGLKVIEVKQGGVRRDAPW